MRRRLREGQGEPGHSPSRLQWRHRSDPFSALSGNDSSSSRYGTGPPPEWPVRLFWILTRACSFALEHLEHLEHLVPLRRRRGSRADRRSASGAGFARLFQDSAGSRILAGLGFKEVVDVDATGNPNALREDIQVHDRSPTLVIDVKGIQGKPEDSECQQAEKHALMRSREWKKTDVQALTIINAERHLPPLARTHEPFRIEMVENAKQTSSGLMTTWDVAVLFRNAKRLRWPQQAVFDVFYRTGRIQPVPSHYQSIGRVMKRWKSAIGIVPTLQVAVGSRVAFMPKSSMDWIELDVPSILIDDTASSIAEPGSNCGISVSPECLIKEGTELFLVVP